MKGQNKYKKIAIQHLDRRQQLLPTQPTQEELVRKMNQEFQWSDHPLLCYHDTGLSPNRVLKENGLFRVNSFFDAFYYAYTKHGDIVLVPDEIWIMISFYLSTYIDDNAEKLRKKIVNHQGVKTLTIVEGADSVEQTKKMEKQWDFFFDQIIKAIEAQTVKGVVQALICDFSTTTKVYKTISTALVMNSLKKYFEYHRMFAGCGINNVYMAGTREDWAKMIKKLDNLAQFDVDGKLKQYIYHMRVILRNFLDTYDEKPNIQWWNTVMKTPQNRQIYGGEEMEVEGWILNFFGIYEKHIFTGFPEFTVKVPIKLINTLNNTEKHLLLVSDWVSVSKLNERAYKPDVGMCIFTVREGPNRLQLVQKQIQAYKESKKVNYQYVKMNKVSLMLGDTEQATKQTPKKPQSKSKPVKPMINKFHHFLSKKI